MKKLFAMLLAMSSMAAMAQTTGNVGVTSDYRFRGISQTQNGMALQGGADYSHKWFVCGQLEQHREQPHVYRQHRS